MANPSKGEVPFDFKDAEGNDHHFVFRFTNEGKRLTEEAANMTRGEILQTLNFGQGDSIMSALFYGATRKNHKREFPMWPRSVDTFFDDVFDPASDEHEPAEDELPLEMELFISLVAAYQRIEKNTIRRQILGELDDTEPEEAPKDKKQKNKEPEKTEKDES